MESNFKEFFKTVLSKEGYYSNSEWDSGGETLFGISRVYNSNWVGWSIFDSLKFEGKIPSRDKAFILLEEPLAAIYKEHYWDLCNCDKLPSGIDIFVGDSSVNLGPLFITKTLQRVVGVFPDGIIGPKTLTAVYGWDRGRLLAELHDIRSVYYAMESNPSTRKVAIKGWIRRNREVYEYSLKLL